MTKVLPQHASSKKIVTQEIAGFKYQQELTNYLLTYFMYHEVLKDRLIVDFRLHGTSPFLIWLFIIYNADFY